MSGIATRLHYMEVPFMAHYTVVQGLSVGIGVQGGVLLGAESLWNEQSITTDPETKVQTLGTVTSVNKKEGKNYDKWDVTLPVGLSYEYAGVVLSVHYHVGLKNNFTANGVSGGKNRFFMFTAGYRL